jgi:hypothetical protein
VVSLYINSGNAFGSVKIAEPLLSSKLYMPQCTRNSGFAGQEITGMGCLQPSQGEKLAPDVR